MLETSNVHIMLLRTTRARCPSEESYKQVHVNRIFDSYFVAIPFDITCNL
jgi:hypothetical protein